MGVFVDLTGRRFGRLLVQERWGRLGSCAAWQCRCDCGKKKRVASHQLLTGRVSSCGCLHKDQLIARNFRHGFSRRGQSRLYRIWCAMKARCGNSHVPSYRTYGALGVRVCQEWRSSFICFYTWALANGYQEHLTIDRIDPFGNYEPNNCRWITRAENTRNTRAKRKETT